MPNLDLFPSKSVAVSPPSINKMVGYLFTLYFFPKDAYLEQSISTKITGGCNVFASYDAL